MSIACAISTTLLITRPRRRQVKQSKVAAKFGGQILCNANLRSENNRNPPASMVVNMELFFRCVGVVIVFNPAIGGTFLCLLMPVPSPDKWGRLRQEGHPA